MSATLRAFRVRPGLNPSDEPVELSGGGPRAPANNVGASLSDADKLAAHYLAFVKAAL
jgi:hypothetical protein